MARRARVVASGGLSRPRIPRSSRSALAARCLTGRRGRARLASVTRRADVGIPWHLIEKPRAPFHCDVCGQAIADDAWHTFTTLPKMYYETPPAGYVPCNRGFDALGASYDHVIVSSDLPPREDLH